MVETAGFDFRLLRALALLLLAVKLVLLLVMPPFMDETYYFVWGQHLSLSYFDHPPLVGWTEAISGTLFGWTTLGLRAPVLLTLLGDIGILWLIARQQTGDGWRHAFWTSVLLLLVTPILFGLTSVALPDHLLVFFTLLLVFAFARLRAEMTLRWLYLAAVAIGFATLAKYNGALLGAAAVISVIASQGLRPLLRSPHFYLAIALAIAMQGPVLAWNMQHDFASLQFIFGGRQGLHDPLGFAGVWGFLLGALGVLSPFWLLPLGRLLADRQEGSRLPRLLFLLSTLGFLLASLFTNILIHWNVIAYIAVLPLLTPWFRSRLLLSLQLIYGVLAIGIAGFNYVALPITALTSHTDQTSGWSYGWDEVAAAVQKIRATEPVSFIAATDYALASPLAFALRDPDVTSLSSHRDAYDFWFDAGAHAGEAALIVADHWRPLDKTMQARFKSVEAVETVDVTRFGRAIDSYTIYIAKVFVPSSQVVN